MHVRRDTVRPLCLLLCMFLLLLDLTKGQRVQQELRHEKDLYSYEETAPTTIEGADPPPVHITYVHVNYQNSTFSSSTCRLRMWSGSKGRAHEMDTLQKIAQMVEVHFTMVNGSGDVRTPNPLTANNTWSYKADQWSRVFSSHGQTILSLPFHYKVMSAMTLSFGVFDFEKPVQLIDEPYGCIDSVAEEGKLLLVTDLLLRNLDDTTKLAVTPTLSTACHQMISIEGKVGKFKDRCCYVTSDNKAVKCVTDFPNAYLDVLHSLLLFLKFAVFFFGARGLPDWLYSAAYDHIKYYVRLKKPLTRTIAVVRDPESATSITSKHTIDLRNAKNYRLCRRALAGMPYDTVIPSKISQYNIDVNYKKLLTENHVEVGVIPTLSRAVFMCKMSENDAFKDCCHASLCGCLTNGQKCNIPWISVCSIFGRVLLAILLPTPIYIRVAAFYLFEDAEIKDRQTAADRLGVSTEYSYNIIQYLSPTHFSFILLYAVYMSAAIVVAFFSGTDRKTRFQQSVMDAFADLNNLSMFNAVGMLVANCLWPFTAYGVFGVFVCIIVWPLLFPISLVICCLYCIPLIFLSCRIIRHVFRSSDIDEDDDDEVIKEKLRAKPERFFVRKMSKLYRGGKIKRILLNICFACMQRRYFVQNLLVSLWAILTLIAVMAGLSEVVYFFGQAMCYTLMGVIVNASAVLKYGSLILLVILYSYECYDNVSKKYVKLNKAIFSEIKFRLIKDIEQFTQLPSEIQENRGFKSVESSDQAEYETEDDPSTRDPKVWSINDLILFIDKYDCPRIPRKLFDEVCQIKTSGSPGPVYISLILATRRFSVILLFLAFVFIVVLSFGQTYGISQTNQALATMAGGFLPFMFRSIFKPEHVDVEAGLLSFRSKLEEIIKNYKQDWPMCDIVVDIDEPKPEESAEASGQDATDVESLKERNNNNKCTDKKDKPKEKNDQDKKDNEKDKKDNEKDKKDNDKDKKDKDEPDKDWLKKIQRIKSVSTDELVNKLEAHESLRAADGQKVDLVFIFTDREIDWRYSVSDSGQPEADKVSEIVIPRLAVNGNFLPNGRKRSFCYGYGRKQTVADTAFLSI